MDSYNPDVLAYAKMEKLTTFMYNHISRKISQDILRKSSASLKFIAVGMEDNYYKTLKIKETLPKLEKIVLTYDEDQYLTRKDYFKKIQKTYPHAKIKVEKVESYMSYANAHLRLQGADKMIQLTDMLL